MMGFNPTPKDKTSEFRVFSVEVSESYLSSMLCRVIALSIGTETGATPTSPFLRRHLRSLSLTPNPETSLKQGLVLQVCKPCGSWAVAVWKLPLILLVKARKPQHQSLHLVQYRNATPLRTTHPTCTNHRGREIWVGTSHAMHLSS